MSQFFDDARANTSSPDVRSFLDRMEEFEATRTAEENARTWEWIRDYLKASPENPGQVG